MPDGFEIYETVNGLVYLRRQQPKLIREKELEDIRQRLAQLRAGHRYQVEDRGKVITIHESSNDFGIMRAFAPRLSAADHESIEARFAHYQPVMRFTLLDEERRRFAPERFCFRGSVDDWIPIGPPGSLNQLAAKYLKHLGQDSLYELY